MNISLDELDVDVIESTSENEDAFDGRWGWYWHEIHHKPRGPFTDPAAAVFDFAEWLRRRYVEPPPPPEGDQALAVLFLRNAQGFLDSAGSESGGEIELAACCYALELMFKSYLLSRGFSDAWNAQHIGHDLAKAYALAVRHGLPDDDARIDQFIRAVNDAFVVHGLMARHNERPDLVSTFEMVSALRSLHREVERRLA